MQLPWTEEAATDLERIADYLFEHAPHHAERVVRKLYDAPSALLNFLDWAGRVKGTARANWFFRRCRILYRN